MRAKHVTIEPGYVVDRRYRVTEEIGRGGMGSVYKAEHVALKRPVALKLLNQELRGYDATHERLAREAFATGRLQHENCVAINDSGELEDGTPYLAMEFLDGRTLSAELELHGALPLPVALGIARGVLAGLAHAHEAGVVHRDLKPANIFLIAKDDDPHFPKILDFGIAKLVGDAMVEEGGDQLTQAGMAIGSPTYMSPEQAFGGEIAPASDLYSLSVVLFEMLTNRPPFQDADKLETLRQHMIVEPPAMSEVAPEARVPHAVEGMVRAGLAKRPEERIASAADYIAQIDAVLQGLESTGAWAPAAAIGAVGPPTASTSPRPITAPLEGANRAPSAGRDTGSSSAGGEMRPSRRTLAVVAAAAGLVLLSGAALLFASGTGDEDGILRFSELDGVLDEIEDAIEEGRAHTVHRRLTKLAPEHRQNARVHVLLGRSFMEKRYWRNGFEAFETALELDPSLRDDGDLIEAAILSLTSSTKPELGISFLARKIGEPALPLLLDAVDGDERRQAENAQRAIDQIHDGG